MDIRNKIIIGNNLETSRKLPPKSFHTFVTSPPYYNLRDYGVDGQLGREGRPRDFVMNLVTLFGPGHLYDALRDDGTLWVNLGDSYNNGPTIPADPDGMHGEIKSGDIIGTPLMFAMAMRSAGWYWRSTVIWEKPRSKPEPTNDRPTNNFEYFFLFSKSHDYYYDADAIAEPYIDDAREIERRKNSVIAQALNLLPDASQARIKNRRAVWHENGEYLKSLYQKYPIEVFRECLLALTQTFDLEPPAPELLSSPASDIWCVAPQFITEGHPAPYPPELTRRCIQASCPKGGLVGDPFFGTGTTGYQAKELGCDFVGLELNQKWATDIAYRKVGGEIVVYENDQLLTYAPSSDVEALIALKRRQVTAEPEATDPVADAPAKEKAPKPPREKAPAAPKPKKLTVEERIASLEL